MNILRKIIYVALAAVATVACNAQTRTSVKQQLRAAVKDGHTVLMVVSDKDNPSTDLVTLSRAAIANQDKVTVIEMDKDNKANSALVNEYRIGSAPMPLLLIFSNKGLLLGGMTEQQATKEAIVEALPTPKYSEMVLALSQGKSVIAVVSNSKFKSDKSANRLGELATGKLSNGAVVIKVDTEDSAEAKLISMLDIQQELTDSYIVAINGQGMMTGRFEKLPTVVELVDAAMMTVQSSCAPGGCGPSCH